MQDAVPIEASEQDFAERPDLMPAHAAYSQAMAEAGVLTGFFLIDVPDLDAALDWAAPWRR